MLSGAARIYFSRAIIRWIAIGITAAALVLRCSSSPAQLAGGNTSEVGSGKIVGKIFAGNGDAAGGATVRAVPADFRPDSLTGETGEFPESMTDTTGEYRFDTLAPGIYTIEGKLGALAVVISGAEKLTPGDTVYMPNATLSATGAVSGIAQLNGVPPMPQPQHALRRIGIYIKGTTFYTSPDTTGAFVIDSLPLGEYVLTVEPWLRGYYRYEYDITIAAGDTVDLDTIQIDPVP